MEEKEIQELEGALARASPLPWRKSRDWDDPGVGVQDEEDGWIRGPEGIVIDYEGCGSHKWNIRPEDRAYLLAAANAAPSLISDARALLEARKLLRDAMEWIDPHQDAGLIERIEAFRERRDRERSESGGSEVVHDPSKEER